MEPVQPGAAPEATCGPTQPAALALWGASVQHVHAARQQRAGQHHSHRLLNSRPLTTHAAASRPPHPQVYYPVAPEVYRDLLWEDVDVADPVEYTFCRYTPVTTEVRARADRVAATRHPPESSRGCKRGEWQQRRCGQHGRAGWHAYLAPMAMLCYRSLAKCSSRCSTHATTCMGSHLLPHAATARRMRGTLAPMATACACSTSSAGTSSCSFA